MSGLLLSWLIAPAVLVLLCAGAGLLAQALVGSPRLGVLTAPFGAAVLIVVGTITTLVSSMASATVWVMVVVSGAGWITWLVTRERMRRVIPWAAAVTGLTTFAAFAAPVVMSGSATWAGWVKLDDGASWLAFTDFVMSAGRAIPDPIRSTYDALIKVNFAGADWGWFGYPRGSFPLLGATSKMTGIDAAWLLQPYMALIAAMLSLVLFWILSRLLRRAWWAVVGAVTSSMAATYYGYALWGGVKEMLLAMLTALLCATAALALGKRLSLRVLAYPVLVSLAILAISGINAVGVVGPVALGTGLLAWWQRWPRQAIIGSSAIAGAGVMIAVLVWRGLLGSEPRFGVQFPDTGNLVGPLNPWQAVGIWPTGDFRAPPDNVPLTVVLIALGVVLALAGVVHSFRAQAWALPLLLGTQALLIAYALYSGDAWLGGKILAAASPAILAAAFVGVGWLLDAIPPRLGTARRRVTRPMRGVAIGAAALLVAGVLWSDALAYHQVWLAPRDRQAELEDIGRAFAGQGPALMTNYDVYGTRHFLRALAAESPSELRVHTIPLRDGSQVGRGASADIDAFPPSSFADYPLLVLRRSPLASRPPANYQLAWSGQFYEVWRRDPARGTVVASIPLQSGAQPAARADCQQILDLAARYKGGLVAARRTPVIEVPLPQTDDGAVMKVPVTVPVHGVYEIWLAGSFPGELEVRVDTATVYTGGSVIEGDPAAVNALSAVDLTAGTHIVELRHTTPLMRPGSGAGPFPMGPIYLAQADAGDTELVTVGDDQAPTLCGQTLDWVEVVQP